MRNIDMNWLYLSLDLCHLGIGAGELVSAAWFLQLVSVTASYTNDDYGGRYCAF